MTEDDLVAAIRAAPDDDGPRMVYADWLQQQGDPLGAYIALKLEEERMPRDHPQRHHLDSELRRLRVYERWMTAFDQHVGVERGMASSLSLSKRLLQPALVEALRGTMIRDLQLHDGNLTDASLDLLERAAARMAVRRLRFRMWCPEGQLARIWSWFPDAEDVEIGGLGDDEGRALARAPWRRLTRLGVFGIGRYAGEPGVFGDDAADAVAHSPGTAALRELELTELNVRPRGAAALLDGTLALASLDLAGNPIGSDGVVAMMRMPGVARLHALGLAGVGFDDAAAAALAATPALANLRRLVLSHYAQRSSLSDTGVAALIASPHLSRDLELVLGGETLGLATEEDVALSSGLVTRRWAGEPPAALTGRFRITIAREAP